jgi:hypothetical protein
MYMANYFRYVVRHRATKVRINPNCVAWCRYDTVPCKYPFEDFKFKAGEIVRGRNALASANLNSQFTILSSVLNN